MWLFEDERNITHLLCFRSLHNAPSCLTLDAFVLFLTQCNCTCRLETLGYLSRVMPLGNIALQTTSTSLFDLLLFVFCFCPSATQSSPTIRSATTLITKSLSSLSTPVLRAWILSPPSPCPHLKFSSAGTAF